MTGWVNGLAEWIEGQTAYLSIAFTWRLPDARARAIFHGACGLHVRAGGPALFTQRHFLDDVADVTGEFPDAIVRHHPQATTPLPASASATTIPEAGPPPTTPSASSASAAPPWSSSRTSQ